MATETEADGRPAVPSDITEFRSYVRRWLPGGLPKSGSQSRTGEPLEEQAARHRELQRRLWDAHLAGICYPVEYGGLGLTREHQAAFLDETAGYELPTIMAVTHAVILPTLLDFGTPEQCAGHVPAALRGEEIAVQLLSEPSGGSDMAGALTRAIKDDDIFIINGAKVWSTGAQVADYGLLLARTDPELSKHSGLSMFVVPLDADGVTVNPIQLATGASEFCEEFFDDVKIPATNLVGQLNDGWAVASRLLFHERSMVGDSGMNDSRYTPAAEERSDPLVNMVQRLGTGSDPLVRQLLGEALALAHVKRPAVEHISEGLRSGRFPGPGASLLKLLSSHIGYRRLEIAMEIAGDSGIVWEGADEESPGIQWLGARAHTLAGGTTEMQLNQISERVLGLPRDPSADRDLPFSKLPHN
ncbi:acyl-CoA dehydrogenase family protein [Mycobacterium sp. CVI_P3]|uniref:Acyl-CoA dehydrogenase family protein n=1 Tax=Mycobacterium pinniadriaticum TaxID=2994102 RepID=A0ABT3SL03_9MYCO|nr:acyl-CoA dehydrogenase family protein [Mycobacterium pinniadriaticum]MCX2933764.1 acyl-CoA dehydrogenase family protein [Mycobacterium pinniadriaticum]MCX2940186.1 acyl-CoA dehydrogenase family protein [Mycobacterium pinniadriaticum]